MSTNQLCLRTFNLFLYHEFAKIRFSSAHENAMKNFKCVLFLTSVELESESVCLYD